MGIASTWRERLKSHTQRYNPTIATVACGSVPLGSECILAIGRLIGILLWLHNMYVVIDTAFSSCMYLIQGPHHSVLCQFEGGHLAAVEDPTRPPQLAGESPSFPTVRGRTPQSQATPTTPPLGWSSRACALLHPRACASIKYHGRCLIHEKRVHFVVMISNKLLHEI